MHMHIGTSSMNPSQTPQRDERAKIRPPPFPSFPQEAVAWQGPSPGNPCRRCESYIRSFFFFLFLFRGIRERSIEGPTPSIILPEISGKAFFKGTLTYGEGSKASLTSVAQTLVKSRLLSRSGGAETSSHLGRRNKKRRKRCQVSA